MRTILHSDANSFYASVEMLLDPSLREKAVAVCGSTENRHGIVLAKSEKAKKAGVKTGQANWEAKQACPDLIMVPPQYDQYLKFSKLLRAIYLRYTDQVEPFGMDECWLDVSGCGRLHGSGEQIAEEIRKTVREELGITVSVGVSFNKIFAKLGSDLKKPDAVTVLDETNWKERIWPLPVSELLYVGHATTRKLVSRHILTIGDLANTDPELLRNWFGKNGVMLWSFACGLDQSRVMQTEYIAPIKSVGHGTTCVIDLETDYQVWLVLYELAQDVGHRLLKNDLSARGVQITVKDMDLGYRQYQMPLKFPSQSPLEIAQAGFALFKQHYNWLKPVRALTIRGINLIPADQPVQLDMFCNYRARERRKSLDDTIDEIRRRFGYHSICAASLMGNLHMAQDKCETVTMPGLMYR